MRNEGIPEDVVDAIEDGVPAVRAFRVETEITVGELSEDTGITAQRLNAIEDGAPPEADEIEAIGAALHVPPDILAQAIAA